MFGIIEDPMIAWNLRNLDKMLFVVGFSGLALFMGFLGRKNGAFLGLTVATTGIVFLLLMVTHNKYGYAF